MHDKILTPFDGWLLPVGYADPATDALVVDMLASNPLAVLLDVRLRARSRWYSQWNKTALQVQWGERYVHEPRLGNVNYQYPDRPILLAEPEPAASWVITWLQQGYSFLVVCACRNYETCHRKAVVEYLLQACREVSNNEHS